MIAIWWQPLDAPAPRDYDPGMSFSAADRRHMERALALARQGEGLVEPNPMVGAVVARGEEEIAAGWHQKFGGPHAEVEALRAAGERARGATLYVTLEPCCHQGKTPPCTDAILAAGIARVVAAQVDPFPRVAGGGLAQLKAAGVAVETGLCEREARSLNAPYLKLLATGRPWVIAKWAMTLDGKLATRTGDSRWISGEASRAVAHQLRGRVDAIIVGGNTARIDDPLLTARPPGPRVPLRVVIDSWAMLASDSQLVRTARETPVLVAVGPPSTHSDRDRLASHGCEPFLCDASNHAARFGQLLDELGRRRLTNVLVEGGSQLLGLCFDHGLVDEVHVFVAPKVIGGNEAPSPVAGVGRELMADSLALEEVAFTACGEDLYLRGRCRPSSP